MLLAGEDAVESVQQDVQVQLVECEGRPEPDSRISTAAAHNISVSKMIK